MAATASSHTAEYYSSLPLSSKDRCIRILDLDAAPSSSAPLTGSLRVVSLRTHPRFATLSYVWGPYAAERDVIICRNADPGSACRIDITANCDAALRQLRDLFGCLSIWVDAVCINQDDIAEKETQIPMMEEIYTWAAPAYIWLGPGTAASDEVMDWFSRLTEYRGSIRPDVECWRATGWIEALSMRAKLLLYRIMVQHKTGLLLGFIFLLGWVPKTPKPEAFLDFLSREWIQRIWTFQEFVLPWTATIVCGSKTVSADDFVVQLFELREVFLPTTTPPPQLGVWEGLGSAWLNHSRPAKWKDSGVSDISLADKAFNNLGAGQLASPVAITTLVTAVWAVIWGFICPLVLMLSPAFSGYFSTAWSLVAAQLISMVLGLAIMLATAAAKLEDGSPGGSVLHHWRFLPAGCSVENKFRNIIPAMRERNATVPHDLSFALHGLLRGSGFPLRRPEYAKDIVTIFQDLFCDLLTWDPSLIKLVVDAGRLPAPAPTWTPDFSAAKSWIDPGYCNGSVNRSAAGDGAPLVQFVGNELRVQGMLYDTVTVVSGTFQKAAADDTDTMLQKNLTTVLKYFVTAQRDFVATESAHGLPASLHAVLHQAVLATPYERHAGDNELADRDREFREWYRLLARETVLSIAGFVTLETEVVERVLAAMQTDPAVGLYFQECCRGMAGKRVLFISAKGYLGTGPEGMRVGDEVGLLAGVAMPLILRRAGDDDRLNVVGPAYVSGVMKGEEWRTETVGEIVLV